ncbi:hypothetical protein ACFL6B_01210 [Thermodesulfobacteriota bacterium]
MQVKDNRPYSGKKRIDFKGTVTLKNVSFQYRDTRISYQIDLAVHLIVCLSFLAVAPVCVAVVAIVANHFSTAGKKAGVV